MRKSICMHCYKLYIYYKIILYCRVQNFLSIIVATGFSMSNTNVSHVIVFAFGFRSRCSSHGKENHQCPIWKRYRSGSQASHSPYPSETLPSHWQNCSPFSTYLIAPGNLCFFGPGMLCHDFIKVLEEHVSNAVDRILEWQQERLKIIRL